MKHTLKVTFLMLALFFMAQVIGLLIVNQYIDHAQLKEGKVSFTELPYKVERPQVNQTTSFTYIFAAIILGTLILLLFIKFNLTYFWKFWFFISIVYVLTVSFSAFLNIKYSQYIALVLSLILTSWRLFWPNFYIHNLTELFVYGGLAAIIVPLLNLISVFALLILISLYDMYAVWKSRHMIKMAQFTAKQKVFAGIFLQYKEKKAAKIAISPKISAKKVASVKNAILGGGDIGFPLIFAGVVMKDLMLKHSVIIGFIEALIVVVFVTLALAYLFWQGEKEKFYPAMPYLSGGCLAGWLVVQVIELLI